MLIISMILCVSCCLSSPTTNAQTVANQPKAANRHPVALQFMVAKQPFPYANGVAMDKESYDDLRMSVVRDGMLIAKSRVVVDSLKVLVGKLDNRIASLTARTAQDEQTLQIMLEEKTELATKLAQSERAALVADIALLRLRGLLPRRVQKRLPPNATPDQIATALIDHQARLEKRAIRQSIGGIIVGAIVATVVLL